MSTHPRVGVVVLNWRRPDDILACLRSVSRLDYPDLEVTVVDNASANGSVATIRDEFPHIALVENARNMGFAGGSNQGITRLIGDGAQYVLLLNDDTEIAPDLVWRLVEVAEADPSIGILGPTIYYYGRRSTIWSAGGEVDPDGTTRHLQLDESDDGLDTAVRDVGYVTGCCMLVSRRVVEALGVLDERFFAYFEEAEWCTRARRAGFRVVHVPSARVWHKIESASRESRPYIYLMARNRLLYLHCSGARLTTVCRAVLSLLRTTLSWRLRPRHHERRAASSALVWGILDFLLGRFGAPPAWL
jgi:GT2 family glycosyltransferase